MFRILGSVIFFVLSQHCVFANEAKNQLVNQCESFLLSASYEIVDEDGIFDTVLESLKDYQMTFRQSQSEALREFRGRMNVRATVDVSMPGLYVKGIPALSQETIDVLDLWAKNSDEKQAAFLKEWVDLDPYLQWLSVNWKVSDELALNFKTQELDKLTSVDGVSHRLFNTSVRSAWDYFERHLKFVGPMNIKPELVVLKIMKDHDSQLSEDDIELIDEILDVEKQIYVLSRLIYQLEVFAHGSPNDWQRYGTIQNIRAHFQILKTKLKEWFPDFNMSAFLWGQMHGQYPVGMSFEDYILKSTSSYSFDRDYIELREDYRKLKTIIYTYDMIEDIDVMSDELWVQVETIMPYFLY